MTAPIAQRVSAEEGDRDEPQTPPVGGGWGRRALLGLITALLVARPLVLGEDPGLLLDRLSDPWGMVLTLLWLCAGAAWAGWQLWHRTPRRPLGMTGVSLAHVVVFVAISSLFSARYKHPAWLICWEWLALWVAYWVVTQAAADIHDRQRLLAALIAIAVSISCYAIYQSLVELPALRQQLLGNAQHLRQALQKQGVEVDPDQAGLALWQERIGANHVFGTFAHPNTFAGFLALSLPIAFGAAWTILRQRDWRRACLAACAAGLIAVALAMTHSRGAILGSLLVALALVFLHFLMQRQYVRVALLIAVAVAGLVLVRGARLPGRGMERATQSFSLRLDYWRATWRMIWDPQYPVHRWLGVGPGNFSRWYPRYMSPMAPEKVSDPHNFVLEIWATAGILALAALLLALAAFFWQSRATWWAILRAPGETPVRIVPSKSLPRRREFYLGGLAGFVLALCLSNMNHTGDQVLWEAILAAGKAMVWFAVFFALDGALWVGPRVQLAVVVGVAALLLNLLASGGIGFSSLAVLLWVVVALARTKSPERGRAVVSGRMASGLGPIWILILCGVYVGFYMLPVLRSNRWLNEARAEMARTPASKIIDRLQKAAAIDPGNAILWVELGNAVERTRSSTLDEPRKAEDYLSRAIALDPEGKEGYLAVYGLNRTLARSIPGESQERYLAAAQAMRDVSVRDPTEAKWHYLLAEVLHLAGEMTDMREEAERALECDRNSAANPARQLTNVQRSQLRQWLNELRSNRDLPAPPGSVTISAIDR